MTEQALTSDHAIQPSAQYLLGREYRDTSSLRAEGEMGIYVDSLHTGVAKFGEILSAEDMFDSLVIIFCDSKTSVSYLAIVGDSMTSEQSLKMGELVGGQYDLVVAMGKGSQNKFEDVINPRSSVMEAFFDNVEANIGMIGNINIDYGGRGWCIAFDPVKRLIKIYTKSDKMIKEYKI